jgi:RimJ/RimL family protein N-acetyltransferase
MMAVAVHSTRLRPVELADAANLLRWVNSPDSLQWKRETTKAITVDEHRAWLTRRLSDAGTLMWIIESDQQPVGQVRLQRDNDAFMIDIYVEAGHRKGGLAATAINAALTSLSGVHRGASVVADVHKDNQASRRLFERLGFRLAGENGDWLRYQMSAHPMKAGRP